MSASPANCGEPSGIPYYLPKPLLVVSKNFHHVRERQVGLTEPAAIPTVFDDQKGYGDVNLSATFTRASNSKASATETRATPPAALNSSVVPGTEIPSDGLAPHTFFTYEILFVPDLTQKYMLQIEGGSGEMRAAVNMVNGWMFTGLGPYYLKDSSTAQNILARGTAIGLTLGGAADIVNSVAQLRPAAGEANRGLDPDSVKDIARDLAQAREMQTADFAQLEGDGEIERYAEIYIYEGYLDETGQMAWRPIVGELDPLTQTLSGHQFSRRYLGAYTPSKAAKGGASAPSPLLKPAMKPPAGSHDTAAETAAPRTIGPELLDATSPDTTRTRNAPKLKVSKPLLIPPEPEQLPAPSAGSSTRRKPGKKSASVTVAG
jgi:hypothetical protein